MEEKLTTSDPLPQIPSCKVRGRLIPAYEFLPRLRTLCSSLGFHNPIVTRPCETAANLAERLTLGYRSSSDAMWGEQDHIVIFSAMIPYEQNWGAYTGLPGQRSREDFGKVAPATPAEFIAPYVRQYRFAQEHIRLGCDSTGKPVVTIPEGLVSGKGNPAGVGLQVHVDRIAEAGKTLQRDRASAGSLVTLPLSAGFRQILDEREFSWQPGVFSPIGEYFGPELFFFAGKSPQDDPPPFPAVAELMPRIVTQKNPELAATLVHLQAGFSGICDTFAATGPDDLRNLICVSGLEIDMRGFRGRKERYFVPWQACWKRHGYCYGNIYPLLQDDLFVALMNFNRMGSGAEYTEYERL